MFNFPPRDAVAVIWTPTRCVYKALSTQQESICINCPEALADSGKLYCMHPKRQWEVQIEELFKRNLLCFNGKAKPAGKKGKGVNV